MKTTTIKTLALALALCFALITQTACPKKSDTISYTRQFISATQDVLPILESMGHDTLKIRRALAIANQLLPALEQNQNAAALDQLAALIPVFQSIVSDVTLIPDQAKRTLILATLAVAQIDLRTIAEIVTKAAQEAMASGPARAPGTNRELATVSAYRTKKKWRCRSSQTGQWAQMAFCQKHPDVSTVETY